MRLWRLALGPGATTAARFGVTVARSADYEVTGYKPGRWVPRPASGWRTEVWTAVQADFGSSVPLFDSSVERRERPTLAMTPKSYGARHIAGPKPRLVLDIG